MLLPWTGDRALFTATIALRSQDIEASVDGPAIQIPHNGVDEVEAAIRRLLDADRPQPDEMAPLGPGAGD